MSETKRARACDNCHSIKIKCELGSVGGDGPCNRCVRLGKDCKVTPPKRQKDRVAELEAQVEALTKLLETQKLPIPSPESEQTTQDRPGPHPEALGVTSSTSVSKKKRKLTEDVETRELTPSSYALDSLLSRSQQSELLERYLNDFQSIVPLVPVDGDVTYNGMRKHRPLLLQALIYVSCQGVLNHDLQEGISKIALDSMAAAAIAEGDKSLELLQAIQVTSLWFRNPKHASRLMGNTPPTFILYANRLSSLTLLRLN
jgi:hypothetical protein